MQFITKYFPDLNSEQQEKFNQLESLYKSWNQKINLISRKDIDHFYLKHVLHSLAIAKFISFTPGTKILDVGTGGGFPGIPLAVFFPECEFLLVDSIEKKISVVKDIVNQLKLVNCSAQTIRAEQIHNKFDFIVSRAVAPMPKFYTWVKQKISRQSKNILPNGIIYLKGGDLTEELEMFDDWYTTTDITKYFDEEFFETKKIIHLFKF
jgi:16S rRNA (guanine527-N7)-methyltransferase